jgi:hypothetical protein
MPLVDPFYPITCKRRLIHDGQRLVSACYEHSEYPIKTYDDGFGPLWISRNSIGIYGIVRAQSWGDAYSICEDEFFDEADETVEELIKEYGFKVDHRKVVQGDSTVATDHLSAGERFAVYPDDYPDGTLKPHFIRWARIETPDPDAWTEHPGFCEGYGFRNNGPNERDTHKHGIYQKDLNGDALDRLTEHLVKDIGIKLVIEMDEPISCINTD